MAGPEAYLEDAAGGGPFSIAEWEPNNRILYNRWDDFWAGLRTLAQAPVRPDGVSW